MLKTGFPTYLADQLQRYDVGTDMTTRLARDHDRLKEPRIKSNYGARSFRYNAPRLYNNLPVDIKKLDNVETFKKKLKTHFFRKAYNLTEKTLTDAYAT